MIPISFARAWKASLIALPAACAEAPDPSSQTPVDPAAGLYEISLSAGGQAIRDGGDTQKTYCLRQGDAGKFGEMLVENYYKLHASCRLAASPRVGNAISGEIRCAADRKLADGSNRFVYRGVVARDAVNVSVQIKFDAEPKAGSEADTLQIKLAMKALELARVSIDAVRVGDCR